MKTNEILQLKELIDYLLKQKLCTVPHVLVSVSWWLGGSAKSSMSP
jgi:hypothetical protein